MTPNWFVRYERSRHERYLHSPQGIPQQYNHNYSGIVNIIRQSFTNSHRINDVLWEQLYAADSRLRPILLQKACYNGWEYDYETRKLRQILQSLTDPTPFRKEDYL